jgi:hypothetical protein
VSELRLPSEADFQANGRTSLIEPFRIKPLRGIEWVILAYFRGSVFFGPILLFDRHHPSAPTCKRDLPTRAAAVKDGPSSGHRFSGAKRP